MIYTVIKKTVMNTIIAGCNRSEPNQVCTTDPETGVITCETQRKDCKAKGKSGSDR